MNKLKLLKGLSFTRIVLYSIILIWTIVFLNTTYKTTSITDGDALSVLSFMVFMGAFAIMIIAAWLSTIYWAIKIDKEKPFPKLVLFTVISFFGVGTLLVIYMNKKRD